MFARATEMIEPTLRKTFGALAAAACLAGALGLPAAHASETNPKFRVVHDFTSSTDGSWPAGALISDKDGNLYGTTSTGGPNGAGTVFKLAPDGTETLLHAFNGADGDLPMSGLLKGPHGKFYGVTEIGGKYGAGNVYEITKDGVVRVIYEFGAAPGDGWNPVCDLAWSPDGALLGTTVNGGANGSTPVAPLFRDKDGNLVGTTSWGGQGFHGTIFELGAGGQFTTLYTFDGTTGNNAMTGLVRDSKPGVHALYGATYSGGANGGGVIFRLKK
jgi:uncharacterized repeat protein (TIGR03803 family)